ncbi:MAG: hypothetical protein GYA23_01985 [Methanomicrobiales archaeon]|nr:hypothetical protein [Methanomicrobiales archaeon]
MGSPYLSSNESIVLSAHDIVINTIPTEAILTNLRLMLVDRTHPRILPQDIPFTAIETVTIGENTAGEPVLSLSVVTRDGTRQPLGVTFPEAPRVNRTQERDEWAARLRELSVTAQQNSGVIETELVPPWVAGPVPEGPAVPDTEEIVPAGTRFKGPSISERRNKAAGASRNRSIGIAVAIILVIAVVIAGVYFFAPPFAPGPAPRDTPAPTAVPTEVTPQETMPVTTPAPEVTIPTVTETTVVPKPSPQSIIPASGVWARVQYDGAFSGSVGAPGRFKDVTGSGEQFFQIPAKDEIVTATITKLDASGNPLTIGIYQDGTLVKSATITKPKGTISLDADLRAVTTITTP